jgi:hypothetical protein
MPMAALGNLIVKLYQSWEKVGEIALDFGRN